MKSAFQFTNPILTRFEFGLNQGFDNNDNKEVQMQISMSVSVNKINSGNEAEVSLKVDIGEKSVMVPFFINVVESAKFRWEEGTEEEMVNKLLNQNAPSLLLSYVRPIVTQITASSAFGAYNIPFMNFTNAEQ